MEHSEGVRIGERVKILQPEYLAEKQGIVVAKEEMQSSQADDRWLVKVIPEQFLVSLAATEFQQLDRST